MGIVSYAQNFEDVMLMRALSHIKHGLYIDIGAQDPLIDSVSLAFHEQGWRGIHVEPTPHYAELLRQQRPGDTVIQAAVSNSAAVLKFYEIPETGISTADSTIAQQHRERGFNIREITVLATTLSEIFKTCTKSEIHWLKIDVEGFEEQALTGWGKSRARPWIVVVESTLPLTQIESHGTWEDKLITKGYTQVYFDGLNQYYLSDKHPELKDAFRSSPNVFDGFTLNGTASTTFLNLIETRHRELINKIFAENKEQEQTTINEIEHLTLSLSSQEKEYSEHINKLNQDLHRLEKDNTSLEKNHTVIINSLQKEINTIQSMRAQREQEHTEQTIQIHNALEKNLTAQIEREHEVAVQLHAIQQQAEQGKQHDLRLMAEHHKTLLAAKQSELICLIESHTSLVAQLQAEILTEQQNNFRLRQLLVDLQNSLQATHATLTWRMTAPIRKLASLVIQNINTGTAVLMKKPEMSQKNTKTISATQPDIDHPITIESTMTNTPVAATSLTELLNHHDITFVQSAFLTLLDREPDEEGLNYYLGRLRTGVPKIQILGQIINSNEFKTNGANLKGLRRAINLYHLSRKPIIGQIIKSLVVVENGSAIERRVRSMEQEISLFSKQTDHRLTSIDHNTNNLKKLLIEQNNQFKDIYHQITSFMMKATSNNLPTPESSQTSVSEFRSITDPASSERSHSHKTPILRQRSKYILFFVDHTINCPINTGMQRVVRRLGRSLSESNSTIRFVKWDSELQALVLINRDELDHLSKWHGPKLDITELRTYPLPSDKPAPIKHVESGSHQWLIVPEVTHITYHSTPVTLDILSAASSLGIKTAFIYYDAIPLRLKEYKDTAIKHEMYMQHLLLADVIIPISFRSGLELIEFFKIHQESGINTPKIQTISLPGESQLSNRVYTPTLISTGDEFILCVGSIEPRKNQINLVKAFDKFCAANPNTKWRLVLAGNLRHDVAQEINNAIERNTRISHVQNISDAELDSLYRSCSFTVFPSVEEGFGLPILESLWYAKPCICADFGAMGEVASGGGCYQIDTHKISDIENAITQLTLHPGLHHRLALEASRRQISSWNDYTQDVISLIDKESDTLREIEYVYYWVDDTCTNQHNSGIQRVVRQLARALISLEIKLIPIKWDFVKKQPYYPSIDELNHLMKWNGPHPEEWTAWLEPKKAGLKSWLLIPELTHQTLPDVKEYTLNNFLRCAAVFYDAIPWKMRDSFPPSFGENHRQYMDSLGLFDKVFPISNFSRSELIKHFLSTTVRSHSLDHRVETCALPSEFIGIKRSVNPKHKTTSVIRILSVISIEPRKNPLGLLEAFSKACNNANSRLELTLVGRKIEAFSNLSAQVEHHISLLENVVWEHNVDDMKLQSLYSQSDFTIFPSTEEGFGLPILESLWDALPCICHDKGAMQEVAEGGGCLSIDVTDTNVFTDAIVRLSDDAELRYSLALAATQRPIKTWLNYAEEIAVNMATDRSLYIKSNVPTVSDAARMYRDLPNLVERPLLSICISTYNRAEWLSVGLRNLERMIPVPMPEVEIFVCDNTSTDQTTDVVQPYIGRSDFKYLRNESNVGMLGNLRVTAHNASGRYIWILGDDDLAIPGSIEKILSIIRSEPELALIYLNYSYTRETDARTVNDLDAFISSASSLIESSQDISAPVKEIAAQNENLFTAIYCLVFRRDHALRAYSQNTDGRPFSTMRTSIPTTYYVLNFMMDEPAYWLGKPQLVVNFNVSWNKYAALQILERVPEAQDLAERLGASPTGMDRWRENLFPGFVHYFTEMFENDTHSNAEFFSPVRLVARMKHIDSFRTLVPALRLIYDSAHERGHPCAEMPTKQLFAAFENH